MVDGVEEANPKKRNFCFLVHLLGLINVKGNSKYKLTQYIFYGPKLHCHQVP